MTRSEPREGFTRVNHQIRAREVRVIGQTGEQVGILPIEEALRVAQRQQLDLVEVAPKASPPVCRIMDYGKFRYLQKKKAQESRRKSSHVAVKEVKIGARTESHDLDFKVRHVRRFLEKGHRVRVAVFFRGRQITHPEMGEAMLGRVYEKVQEMSAIEIEPRLEGRYMAMQLVPR